MTKPSFRSNKRAVIAARPYLDFPNRLGAERLKKVQNVFVLFLLSDSYHQTLTSTIPMILIMVMLTQIIRQTERKIGVHQKTKEVK